MEKEYKKPLIEKVTVPRAFGVVRERKPKEVKADE